MALENVEDIYRLSPVQQGMLFHTLAAPGSGVYCEQFNLVYRDGFDGEAFVRAWQRVVDRHPVLRTSFLWDGLEQPVQVVHRQVALPVDRQDWRDLGADERERRVRDYVAADRRTGFDLTRPPLVRLGLLRTAAAEHRVIWSYHHTVLDGWSAALLMREVFAFYREETAGVPAAVDSARPFRDYVDWLLAQDLHAAEDYWRRTLAGFTTPTSLGVDAPPAGLELGAGYELRLRRLPAPATAALRSFAQGNRLTLNSVLQGGWALLLARYGGSDDVVFGTTVSGRPPALPGVEAMIGCFINTLPVRVQAPPGQQLVPWLKELQGSLAALRRYEHSPLGRVLGWSAVRPPLPLFASIMVFESFTPETAFEMSHSGVFQRTNYPLTLAVSPGDELALRAGYEPGRFSAAAIARLLGHLEALLAAIVEGGARRLDELSLLSAAERHQLVIEWNAAAPAAPSAGCLHRAFEARAAAHPEAPALVCGELLLSYGELNRRANRLAHTLRGRGVGPEVLVGICVQRSVEMVIGILAILKAGGAYLPLDATYPEERLALMLDDAGAPLVLTEESLLGRLRGHPQALCLDRDAAGFSADTTDLPITVGPDILAYVIYTSGSTGRPKGVGVTHGNVIRLFERTAPWFGFGPDDRWTLFHSYAFDFSVWELWGALLYGGTLVVVPYSVSRSPRDFHALLVREKVTVLNQTPSAFRLLVAAEGSPEEPAGPGRPELALRLVIFGGEALDLGQLAPWFGRHGDREPRLVNMYGITETTVHVTYRPLSLADLRQPQRSVIGQAIPDLALHLLDLWRDPLPVGIAGELYVGGAGLARGYMNRPGLTAERFVPDPFGAVSGARLYRTGDLARYLPDGDIEYLGRIDQQVKVRGFRIELGEIEAALGDHPSVRHAVVAAARDEAGETRLLAYVCPVPGATAPVAELREHLAARLPEHMVPAAFIELAELPLTPTGKLDRRALPAPDFVRPALRAAYTAPQTPVEEALAGIWSEVLHVSPVGVDDDFFALGGDSILSIRVSALARERGFTVLLPQLFDRRTVRELAKVVTPVHLQAADLAERVSELSENEVDAMLAELLAQDGPAA